MKTVVGISLGSSKRNHEAVVDFLGQKYQVKRIGTDGNMKKMIEIIEELDGKVDAFGLGGIDLYIQAVDRRYSFRDARKIVKAAKITPIVDGSGLKNTLERRAIEYIAENSDLLEGSKKVLLMSAMDRLGMAQAFEAAGAKMTYGDLLFAVGVPLPLKSLKSLAFVARLIGPLICQLPFSLIYPTGEKQTINKPRFSRYFLENEIIAGDFNFIYRNMPEKLPGRVIVTNTVTEADVEFLRQRGLKTLVTTTPEMQGRSFGTNVIEALLVSVAGGQHELSEDQYNALLKELKFVPRIVQLS